LIESFRHRGLERFYLGGTKSGVQPKQAERLRLVLGRLAAATSPQDMNLPGLQLHRLKGRMNDRWSVRVSGNWRVTFSFSGKNVIQVDYEDYH
jgi:toxin HigB-1